MVGGALDIISVSQFPALYTDDPKNRPYVVLPMLVLALFIPDAGGNRPENLYLTDFTSNSNTMRRYYGPSDFIVGNSSIPQDDIFIANIFREKSRELKNEIEKRNICFDPTIESDCTLHEHGVVVELRIELKTYRDCIEGTVRGFKILDKSNAHELQMNKAFAPFWSRLKANTGPGYFAKAQQYLLQEPENSSPANNTKRSSSTQDRSFDSTKRTRTRTDDFLFRQHVQAEDTQQPISSSYSYSATTNHDDLGLDSSLELSDSEADDYLVKKLTLKDLIEFKSGKESGQQYEIDACVVGFEPFSNLFRNTCTTDMEIGDLKFIISGKDNTKVTCLTKDNSASIHIRGEKNVLKFLGLERKEDILVNFRKISATLATVIHNRGVQSTIRLQRSVHTEEYFKESYWKCISTLDQLRL